MTARSMISLTGIFVVLYGSEPLIANGPQKQTTPDVCCTETADCPGGMVCVTGGACSPEAEGYCVSVNGE